MSDDKSSHEEKKSKETFNRQDDKWWRWGLFYNNRDDNAIFVRRGAGVKLNYGHRAVQIGMAVIVVLIVVFVIIVQSSR